MPEAFPTSLELLAEAFALKPDYVAAISVHCLEHGIEPAEHIYNERKMSAPIIRGTIVCQLYLSEQLMTKSVAVMALQQVKLTNVTIEDALMASGFDLLYAENVRQLKELLIHSGLITEKQKEVGYEACLQYKLPLLHALVQKEYLTEDSADYVLTVQQLLKNDTVTPEEALELLGRCQKPDGTLADPESANKPLSIKVGQVFGSRLGELLVASTIITPTQLIRAVEDARNKNMLTGEVLVQHGSLTEVDLKRALNAQSRVENGSLTFAEAVGKLDPSRFLPPPS